MLEFMKEHSFAQIAIVVNDLEEAKGRFSKLFGFEVPETAGLGPVEVAQTQYKGSAAPEIECKIAYFNFGNIQVELMQPNDVPSAWRDWMDEHGEGLHHLSYLVDDYDAALANCLKKGMTLVQDGDYADGSGHYAYLETNTGLPFMIELLTPPVE